MVVLTASDQMRDVNRAYQLGANSFFVKELDLQGNQKFGQLLKEYWLNWVRKPQTFRAEREADKDGKKGSGRG